MRDFCPLCMKNGVRRRIKAFQINLSEMIWACPEVECIWPFSYEDLTFHQRDAITCDWEESNLLEQNIPISVELSLYTPPVTPVSAELSRELIDIAVTENVTNPSIEDNINEISSKNEFINTERECTDSNKLLILQLLEPESNNPIKESKNVIKEESANVSTSKTLPKISNIQKTNINFKMFSSVDKHYDNKILQELRYSLTDANSAKDCTVFDNILCKKYDNLNTQCKKESEQSSIEHNVASGVDNFSLEMLSEATKSIVDTNITSLDAINNSVLNTSASNLNIDTMLEDILIDENDIDKKIIDDWLDSLIS